MTTTVDAVPGPLTANVNELVSYLTFYFDSSTKQHLYDIAFRFYTPGEISVAKTSLWEHYGDRLDRLIRRVQSTGREAHQADLNDIFDALKRLDEDDGDTPVYAAVNLSRIPKTSPIVDNAESVSARCDAIDDKISALSANSDCHDYSVQQMELALYTDILGNTSLYENDQARTSVIREGLMLSFSHMSVEKLHSAGHLASKYMVRCRDQHKIIIDCSTMILEEKWDWSAGNLLRLGGERFTQLNSRSIELWTKLEQKEYTKFQADASFKVYILSKHQSPSSVKRVYFASPKYFTSFKIKKTIRRLLTGCKEAADENSYTIQGCLHDLKIKRVEEVCGCQYPGVVTKNEDLPACGLDARICIKKAYQIDELGAEQLCPPPCIEEEWSAITTLSLARNSSRDDVFMTFDFLTDSVLSIEENPSLPARLDVAGIFGFQSGFSAISVIELLFLLCAYVVVKLYRR